MSDVHDSSNQRNNAGIWIPALREAGVTFAAAAVLLVIFYAFAFRWIHPEFVPFMDREATKLIAPGKDLIPVSVGGYRIEGSSAVIEDFNGDEAILALPRAFQAEDYPFIKVNLSGFTRYSKFKILWRRADDPSQTHALEFNRSDDEVTQIAMVYAGENFRGRMPDIALLFYDGPALGFTNNDNVSIRVHSIEFLPFAMRNVGLQILLDWFHPPLLQNYSNNLVRGVHANGIILPNLAINILVVTAILLMLTCRVGRKWRYGHQEKCPAVAVMFTIFLFGWGLLGILRFQWMSEQYLDTISRYAGRPPEQKILNSNLRCARFNVDCKAEMLPFF